MATPVPHLISGFVAQHAEIHPDKTCLAFEDCELTYSETDKTIHDIAKTLLNCDATIGDRIAFYGNPNPIAHLHFMAATSIGAIWQGLNPKYTESELSYILEDARPTIIFAQAKTVNDDSVEMLKTIASGIDARLIVFGSQSSSTKEDLIDLIQMAEQASDEDLYRRREEIDPKAPALMVYTSGSTGRPKGALLTHYGINYCSQIGVERKNLKGRSIICNLPINHVGAMLDISHRTIVGGGTIHFQEKFDPFAMMTVIAEKRLDTWGAVPAVFQMCVESDAYQKLDLTCVTQIAWGGARMPTELLVELKRKTGAQECSIGYGMTESTGGVTFCRLTDPEHILTTMIGLPDPRLPLRLWHADGREVCPGEEGEIQIQGPHVTIGYWNKPEATKDAFTEDGWFKTGDLATVHADGNIELVGRLSYNVYPREVELALEEHEAVALAAVVSRPDPTFQEVGHAFVALQPGKTSEDRELTAFLKERLANYKIPKQITIKDELPRLPIGKVDKVALKKEASNET